MSDGRALTCLVVLDGEVWKAGSVPPPEVAKRIRNPKCWEPVEGQPETAPAVTASSPAVIPAAMADKGIHNLEERPAGTDQAAVIPAGDGNVIGRDPLELIGQPVAEQEPAPADEPELTDRIAIDQADPADLPPEPPRSGKGASENAWRAFAVSREVTVPDEADRTAIITACRMAGVIQ